MVAEKNIINKLTLEVDTNSMALALQLKDDIKGFLDEYILPELESYFNSISQNPQSEIIRFSELKTEINLEKIDDLISSKDLILNSLKESIDVKLQQEDREENISILNTTSEEKPMEAFLYFLKTGSYPWWIEDTFIYDGPVIKQLFEKPSFSEKLRQVLAQKLARKRLAFQFEKEVLELVVLGLNSEEKSYHIELKTLPKQLLNEAEKIVFWRSILEYSVTRNSKKLSEDFIELLSSKTSKKMVSQVLKYANQILATNIETEAIIKDYSSNGKGLDSKSDIELQHKEPQEIDENIDYIDVDDLMKDGVLINNAGLIILHPFLKPFFEKLDFLTTIDGKINIKESKIHNAVHVLHYLACKVEQPFEHRLQFEKYLCDLPLNYPINRHIQLSTFQKEECEELLKAVLTHWTALKSNSVDMLRSEFFMREGKLTFNKERATLFIQRKTQDILLDKIPWNIGLIKIPWKKKILYTEW